MNELLTMLESKYKRLEYIQSTGTQWIDTGISGVCSFDLDAQGTLDNNISQIVIGRGNSGPNFFGQFSYFRKWSLGESWTANLPYTSRGQFTIEFNSDGIAFTYNGTRYNRTVGTANLSRNIYLFGANDSSKYLANAKVFSAKCTQNNQIVRNFIPVMRKSDNEIGMLDLVEGKFYPNAGTGKFTANLDTMYALIQGTPTVQDGRVSGFSSSNYLKIQQTLDTTKRFTFVQKIKITNVSNPNTLFCSEEDSASLGSYIMCYINTSSILKINFHKTSTISIGALQTQSALSINTDYWVKFVFTGNRYELYLSTDGINYILEDYIDSSDYINSGGSLTIIFGENLVQTNWYLRGSIDLNRSYIKIDNTKYKLQAVVGYSKVGTLTENPTGVFSGFSASNYLKTTSLYTTNNMNDYNYEFLVKFTPTASMASECYAIKYYNGSTVRGIGVYNNKLVWAVGYPNTSGHTVRISSSFNIVIGTTYWLKGTYKNKIASLYYSTDGINYIFIGNVNESEQIFKITGGFNIGATANDSYGLFYGSIDLNNTYIKINNKLWFNGLPNN